MTGIQPLRQPNSPDAASENDEYQPEVFVRMSEPTMNGSAPISPALRSQGHNAFHPTVVDDDGRYNPVNFEPTGGPAANGATLGMADFYGDREHPENGHELQTMDPHRQYQLLISRAGTNLSS